MIEVSNLTYIYPHTEKPVLKEISFSVAEGESLGIIGLNGAGKSSLCYAIMGLIPHFYHGTISGDVWVNGINVPDSNLSEVSQHIGLVFQNPVNQLSGAKLTVREEIAFGLENLGIPRETMVERIEWVTNVLGINHLLERNPFQLSGGQTQRVAIASVLALKPRVLVLDEPTSQLDPAGTEEVFDVIETMRKEGITTILVEHKVELLAEYCDRIGIMSNGELKAHGKPGEIFALPNLAEWGIEPPIFTQAYQRIVTLSEARDVPTSLVETVEGLKAYEQKHRSK